MAAHAPSSPEEAALSLAMAVVASSLGPLLLLDGDLNIVAASVSFAAAFALDPATLAGRGIASLGEGEWNVPQLQSLLAATLSGAASIEAYEMSLVRRDAGPRQLLIHAQKLVYLDLDNRRLLIAVTDVTDARADARLRDEALRQNLILLQEVRHRVANSLQIIASVLMQNARASASAETKGHLRDAHNRIMSIAALERQLAGTTEGVVEIHGYFVSLCDSIASSMIGDPQELALVVGGGGGVVDARVSVSLGLIVTELVINALRHAFPPGRSGAIRVDFDARGEAWTLTVRDDGVGMPSIPVRAGLGTSIIQALAKQLKATIATGPAEPGTRVTITHDAIADADHTLDPSPPPPMALSTA